MTTNHDTTWKVVGVDQLRWREWGSQSVVYHPPSGNTHLLNVVAAEVLQILQQNQAHTEGLLQQVATSLEIAPGPELLQQIEALLLEFDEAGLIERVES